ncbi:MAG: endonuclease domain-containing protein [Sphingomonas sp.]
MPKTDETLLRRAKTMRSTPTHPEARLWFHLRAKRLNGIEFSRQVVIGACIVDFVARSHKLVTEVDGDTHGGKEAADARRTEWLAGQGYRVIRFTNRDVEGNMDGVLETIVAALGTAPLPGPLPGGERGA